jgi:hypothetical protein
LRKWIEILQKFLVPNSNVLHFDDLEDAPEDEEMVTLARQTDPKLELLKSIGRPYRKKLLYILEKF